MRPILLSIALLFPLIPADRVQAQGTGTVSGRVVDSASRQPIRGATASIVGTSLAASANDSGRFSIARVPAGAQTLRVRAPGFAPVDRALMVRAGESHTVDAFLVRAAQLLGAARADVAPDERQLFESRPNVGTIRLNARAMDAVPRLGEADPVRVVQFLPGVQAKNDFSSGYSVRGGESDQNLILLDGYQVYNPFHLGGVFSTFIDATVRDVQMHTGAIPARHGGRLSSMLDVRSAEEARAGVHGKAEVSLLAATGTVGGAIAEGRGSWMVAARRTYADQVASLVSEEQVPYHFMDAQGHGTWRFANNARLSVTAYEGRDVLDGSFATYTDDSRTGASGGSFYYSWGNAVAGATLTAPLRWRPSTRTDSVLAIHSLSISTFSSRLDLGEGTSVYTNDLADLRAAGTFAAFSPAHDWTAGYELASYSVGYEVAEGQGSINSRAARARPLVTALFAEDMWRVSPSLLVSLGVRAEAMPAASWWGVSPRFSSKYFTSPNAAFTVAAGRFTQWTHSLSLEDNPIRLFDAWRASDDRNPVSNAWQIVGGYERWFGSRRFVRVEAFYKNYNRLLEADLEENSQVQTDTFVPVNGTSYGADLMIRQVEAGPFSGWLSYTFAVSTRRHDSVSYAPSQDRRHDVNLVASWRAGPFSAGARLGYGSGMPYTEIVGTIPRRRWDPVTNTFGGSNRRAQFEAIGAERNGARLPPTRRLDIYAERRFTFRGAAVTSYASVINVTNAENVLYYTYQYAESPPTRRGVSQLPILPTIGVSIAF